MRVRLPLAASLAATALLVPFAGTAHAVTTTSTKVVYVADPNDDGDYEVYSMPADGSADGTLLFATSTDNDAPALSPDGTNLAYVALDSATFEYHLYVRPSDGSGSATQLTTDDEDGPAWSPDGATIAFTRYDAYPPSIWTVPATGGTPVKLTANGDDAAYSPSGAELVVDHLDATGNPAYLDLVTASNGQRAKVAGTDGGYDAVFSPDGQYLLFTKGVGDCEVDLMRVPVSGGIATKVYGASGRAAESPEYSADGTQIFWGDMDYCDTGAENVYVANADGSSPAVLRGTNADESLPTVSGGTPATLETTAPATPTLSASFAPTALTLSWGDTSTDVSEYALLMRPHGDPAPAWPTGTGVVYQGPGRSYTMTGLTTGTTYDFYVVAIDASGNASAVSALRAVTPTATPVIHAIGTVSSVSANGTFTVSWTGTAAAYKVLVGEKKKSSTGTWSAAPVYSTLVASTTAKSKSFAGAQGHSYVFRVYPLDAQGNSGSLYASTWADVPFNETYSALSYSSGWTSVSSTARWLATYRYATASSRTITLKTETQRFQVIGDKGATLGKFQVYVDGVLKATVDTYRSGSTLTRQVLYTSGVYTGLKYHTIKIVTLGTAGRPKVDIDAIGIYRH